MSDPPPEYVDLVKRMIHLALAWVERHPAAVLRWKTWGDTTYIAELCVPEAIEKLADSRDARRLLEWLDKRTQRKGTLLQACAALELAAIKPEEQRGPKHSNDERDPRWN